MNCLLPHKSIFLSSLTWLSYWVLDNGYYVAYKLIALLCFSNMFIEIKFIMFVIKFISIYND